MTVDEFFDNEKKRGRIIYRCVKKDCEFRGYGRAVTIHDMRENHLCKDEDSAEYSQMKFGNLCPKCREWHRDNCPPKSN